MLFTLLHLLLFALLALLFHLLVTTLLLRVGQVESVGSAGATARTPSPSLIIAVSAVGVFLVVGGGVHTLRNTGAAPPIQFEVVAETAHFAFNALFIGFEGGLLRNLAIKIDFALLDDIAVLVFPLELEATRPPQILQLIEFVRVYYQRRDQVLQVVITTQLAA